MDVSIGLAGKALDVARTLHQLRRRVRVRVHRAFFTGSLTQHYFVSVTNLSAQREVVLTHVWFAAPEVHVTNQARPLPRRLALDEPWRRGRLSTRSARTARRAPGYASPPGRS